MKILVTGAAGFIGYHLCVRLLENYHEVIGFDNVNDYYDQSLKLDRIKELNIRADESGSSFYFFKGDLGNNDDLNNVFNLDFYPKEIFTNAKISLVVNLAAQAGVRYSIENPSAYVNSNLVGFCNIIEKCRLNDVDNFIYASSSSVYGGNKKLPFKETDIVDKPISLYAATKKSNELIAHTYSHLFNLSSIGLRFFTVYGPWGRPDMALFKFTKSIIENKPIKVFNYGNMIRDFTYIDDVVESLFLLINKTYNFSETKKNEHFDKNENYKIFNVGNSDPKNLKDYIKLIEKYLCKKADIIFEEIQPGDVEATYACTESLEKWINYKPNTSIEDCRKQFIEWYLDYYKKFKT